MRQDDLEYMTQGVQAGQFSMSKDESRQSCTSRYLHGLFTVHRLVKDDILFLIWFSWIYLVLQGSLSVISDPYHSGRRPEPILLSLVETEALLHHDCPVNVGRCLRVLLPTSQRKRDAAELWVTGAIQKYSLIIMRACACVWDMMVFWVSLAQSWQESCGLQLSHRSYCV